MLHWFSDKHLYTFQFYDSLSLNELILHGWPFTSATSFRFGQNHERFANIADFDAAQGSKDGSVKLLDCSTPWQIISHIF
jgi:hypothetical protein